MLLRWENSVTVTILCVGWSFDDETMCNGWFCWRKTMQWMTLWWWKCVTNDSMVMIWQDNWRRFCNGQCVVWSLFGWWSLHSSCDYSNQSQHNPVQMKRQSANTINSGGDVCISSQPAASACWQRSRNHTTLRLHVRLADGHSANS